MHTVWVQKVYNVGTRVEFQFLDAKTISISQMFLGNMPLSENTPSYLATFCFSIGAKQWQNSVCLATFQHSSSQYRRLSLELGPFNMGLKVPALKFKYTSHPHIRNLAYKVQMYKNRFSLINKIPSQIINKRKGVGIRKKCRTQFYICTR